MPARQRNLLITAFHQPVQLFGKHGLLPAMEPVLQCSANTPLQYSTTPSRHLAIECHRKLAGSWQERVHRELAATSWQLVQGCAQLAIRTEHSVVPRSVCACNVIILGQRQSFMQRPSNPPLLAQLLIPCLAPSLLARDSMRLTGTRLRSAAELQPAPHRCIKKWVQQLLLAPSCVLFRLLCSASSHRSNQSSQLVPATRLG
jgi:hypothetical protein